MCLQPRDDPIALAQEPLPFGHTRGKVCTVKKQGLIGPDNGLSTLLVEMRSLIMRRDRRRGA